MTTAWRRNLIYILNDRGQPEPTDDIHRWADFMEAHAARVLRQDQCGPYFVSTVFLGLDHGFGDGPPLLWETMVFEGEDYSNPVYQDRYTSRIDAINGHAVAVRFALWR